MVALKGYLGNDKVGSFKGKNNIQSNLVFLCPYRLDSVYRFCICCLDLTYYYNVRSELNYLIQLSDIRLTLIDCRKFYFTKLKIIIKI